MKDPRIRVATLDDAAELARLISPLGYPISADDVTERWAPWEAEGNVALVAEGDGGLLGVITLHRMHVFHRADPVGRITSLAVDPTHQGRGLGRTLMKAAEEELVAAGCGVVEVTSNMRRAAAHAFYEHITYERTSYRFAKALR